MTICQACGHKIKEQPYYWDGDPRLPLHANLSKCGPVVNGLPGAQAFADFLNRNAEYINRRGPPVLLEVE
jgi:hypothetical protein